MTGKKLLHLLAVITLMTAFCGLASAANRYVYYSIADQTYYAEGVCDDGASDGFHTTLHGAAVYVETWDDGLNNGLDALEIGVDDSYGTGTYHVATISGDNIYLVITN
jgi:hypothetical protein